MNLSAHAPASQVRPRLALVLGSGGLNSLAAIPLIEFLQAHQIQPDLLVGCSGGSLTLTLLACGHTGQDMGTMFSQSLKPSLFRKDWLNIAIMLGLRTKGFKKSLSIFNTLPVFKLIKSLVGDRRLEDLDVPLVLQATDFDTGEGVELDSGSLVDAVYASCAAYPFFHPIQINGRWLFDGAFSAPMPILPAARRSVDIVLAVDFSEKLQRNPTSFIEAMVHLNKVLSKSVAQSQMLASIGLHGHEIVHVKVRFPSYIQIWETGAYALIQEAGKRAVAEYGDEILALLQGRAAPMEPGPEPLQAAPAGSPTSPHEASGTLPKEPVMTKPKSQQIPVAPPPTPAAKQFALEVPTDPESLPVLRAYAEAIALEAGFPERARTHIQLALEEIAVNLLMHGNGLGPCFKVLATLEAGYLQWEILDTGQPFAFEQAASRYDGMPTVDQPTGGIGLFLVRKVMDEVRYEPATAAGNRFILIKHKERA